MNAKHNAGGSTIDQVVAGNLRRLRDERGWTRAEITDELRAHYPIEWSEWRIIDLEGARTGHQPASIRWTELIALCLVLEVTLWDLVLPVDPEEMVRIAEPTQQFEVRGKKVAQRSVKSVGRYQFGEMLSGLPGIVFTEKGAAEARSVLTTEGIVMEQIRSRQEQIQELMNQLAENGGEMFGHESQASRTTIEPSED